MAIASEKSSERAGRSRARGQAEPRSTFTTVRGLRLHHLTWGPPDGPPVVLLHGLRSHAYSWARAARYLTPPYRLLAPDMRGHGDSAWSDEGYGLPRYVADFAAWLDAQGLDRILLIGHSAGGRVAVTYAAEHPERVTRLVVVDIGPDVPITPFDPVLAAAPQRSFVDVDDTVRVLRERYPSISAAYLRRLAQRSIRRFPDGQLMWKWDKRVRGNPSPPEQFLAALQALRCPTLLVRGGERAYLTAEGAAQMQALIPDSRLVVIPDAGHNLAEERPATFGTAVRAFFAEA